MYNHILYLVYWLLSSIIVYLAFVVFPDNVVLGNARLGPIDSAIYSGFWITFFVWSMWDFILARGARTDEPVTAVLFFWVVNSIGIWLVARMAHFTGLGLASFFWALILGAVIDILQRLSWKLVTSQGKKVI